MVLLWVVLSESLWGCFLNKVEKDVILPLKPKFYCWYVDNSYNRRNKNQPDELSIGRLLYQNTTRRMFLLEGLHRIKNHSSNFEQEVRIIRDKYIKAGYPFHFIDSIIEDFNQEKEDLSIPTSLFKGRKEVRFQIPFCKRKKKDLL